MFLTSRVVSSSGELRGSKQLIREAIEFHLEDFSESGAQVSAPLSKSGYNEMNYVR